MNKKIFDRVLITQFPDGTFLVALCVTNILNQEQAVLIARQLAMQFGLIEPNEEHESRQTPVPEPFRGVIEQVLGEQHDL